MMEYYPKTISLNQIAKEFPGLGIVDEDEEQRLMDVEDKKRRGKGTPKKAKRKGARVPALSRTIANIFFGLPRGQQENGQEAVEYYGILISNA